MRGSLVIGTLAASAVATLAYQADQLARMARNEWGWWIGDDKPVPEIDLAQWSGIMQAVRNRAIRHKTTPSAIIRTVKGQGRAVWNSDPGYLVAMAKRGPGTPGYAPAFRLALRVLLGGRPYVNIGGRNGFVHRETQLALGRKIPDWNYVNPMLVGKTTFSGPK